MSVPISRRKRACAHFIENGFDLEKTVTWMRREYADDPTVQRSKKPEVLCANIVTMSGVGREKDLNMAAFFAAFQEFQQKHQQALRNALDTARVTESELRNKIESLTDELRTAEREHANRRILALESATAD